MDFSRTFDHSASGVFEDYHRLVLGPTFSKQQDEIGIYDFQVLTQNQWIPRAFNDWRFVLLVMIGSLAIFPDLGNATILALVALIMYTVSGIAHRWFIVFIGVLFGVSAYPYQLFL